MSVEQIRNEYYFDKGNDGEEVLRKVFLTTRVSKRANFLRFVRGKEYEIYTGRWKK